MRYIHYSTNLKIIIQNLWITPSPCHSEPFDFAQGKLREESFVIISLWNFLYLPITLFLIKRLIN